MKHWIYEKCISVIFSNISRNFIKVKHDNIKVGDVFIRISVQFPSRDKPTYFYNCKVVKCDGERLSIYCSYILHWDNINKLYSKSRGGLYSPGKKRVVAYDK